MWCKNRKKNMKEAQKRGEDPSSIQTSNSKGSLASNSAQSSAGKTEGKEGRRSVSSDRSLPSKGKPSAASGTTAKAPAGLFNRKEKVGGSAGIPGLDVAAQEQPPVEAGPTSGDPENKEGGPVGNQLSQMIALLQKGMPVPEVAKSVNVTLDDQTQQLMSNLHAQLMLAAQFSKDQGVADQGSRAETLSQAASYSAEGYRQDYGNHSSGNAFGGHKGGATVEGNSSVYSQESNSNSSLGVENAGVKAALAQLLAQQGMRVSLGGTEISATETLMSHSETYSKPEPTYYSTDRADYARSSSYPSSAVFDENSRGSFSSGGDSFGGQFSAPSGGSGGAGFYGQYSGEARPPTKSYAEAAQGGPKQPKSILKNKASSSAPPSKPGIPTLVDQSAGGYPQPPPHSNRSGNHRGGRAGWN